MKVQTMWWCDTCQRPVQPLGRTEGGHGRHVVGMRSHYITGAPMIEGELVPQREEAMA